ncbi:aminomethyl-transferring glycine dehydrogenase [Sanyastnella coralliicola]|uniref:aminomethyl-transferring glycine dehydrogenase n=1 Tax=Sanyastnella coralliicola TaxID=3069118 RepID=UPI0027B9B952|nr:aminomethyl-transferring glycine dehydrogenase [Longitalea sp. SCSIO 12813]
MKTGTFASRHIGPRESEIEHMLEVTGHASVDELVSKTVPERIRLQNELDLPAPMTEHAYLKHLKGLASKNKIYNTYIGMGYYPTVVPSVIQRNVLENPGWYTAYTPYQAEIAQGRLEALLNFQTMVSDLTGLPIANASLLDEGTAAAEAMLMLLHARPRPKVKAGALRFLVDEHMFPQTLDVLKMRAKHLNIQLEVKPWREFDLNEDVFGCMLQYPNGIGGVEDYTAFTEAAQENGVPVAVATDLAALALLTPPGEWGAEVVFGNSQRFGVPMGYGGPHAAFFATTENYKRQIPGRIIGVSTGRLGEQGLRMALQTREQHIRRDKATSNICTAQALLAVMASMYAVYHGQDGIKRISQEIHQKARLVEASMKAKGMEQVNAHYFDTLCFKVPSADAIKSKAEAAGVNLRYINENHIGISLCEVDDQESIDLLLSIFDASAEGDMSAQPTAVELMDRSSEYLSHPVFNSYHSETDMMRYLKRLENKDLSLTHAMIPLGSCTMKLNAASELLPLTWPEFAQLHPFAPVDQAVGYHEMIEELRVNLNEITGFADTSLQPNSGASGEYTGLLVIRAYHESRGEAHRDICLIPSSAHGTNPASAVMAGMKVVVTKCDENGNVDIEDLRARAEEYSDRLGALMITYPSTHGVYEEDVLEINALIHEHGGQVYMDGANMNAQVGLTNPGNIGADVCHLNLHKTFAIPHGGGGPGMGPICVASHLAPFLPGNPVIETGGEHAISAVASAPYGSALILLISYGYIKMLGSEGLRQSTEMAILNANYIKAKIRGAYDVLYQGKNNTVAHEMIIDCRDFKKVGIEVADIAKRLIDYGFHAPTVSFPVAGTLMIEPTESEGVEELDRFCEAMLAIREEIAEIERGEADQEDNVLKMAPHTATELISSVWAHSYSREKAAYPVASLKDAKFWVSVSRVDNASGDRNLICTCPPLEDYMETV